MRKNLIYPTQNHCNPPHKTDNPSDNHKTQSPDSQTLKESGTGPETAARVGTGAVQNQEENAKPRVADPRAATPGQRF